MALRDGAGGQGGTVTVTVRAKRWTVGGRGQMEDPRWVGCFYFYLFKGVDFCSLLVQKMLGTNVQMQNMFLPGGGWGVVGDEGQ